MLSMMIGFGVGIVVGMELISIALWAFDMLAVFNVDPYDGPGVEAEVADEEDF